MASAGGLTRRRGGGGGASTGDDEDASRVTSPAPKITPAHESRAAETSYTGGENGHKIAFDPRDISESAEGKKQPKLTLMEEVLLMGLKDKQVWNARVTSKSYWADRKGNRAIFRSGTTTFPTLCEDA